MHLLQVGLALLPLLQPELVLTAKVILTLPPQLPLLLTPGSALLIREPDAVVAIVPPEAIVVGDSLLLSALTFPLLALPILLLLLERSLRFQGPLLIGIAALPVLVLPVIQPPLLFLNCSLLVLLALPITLALKFSLTLLV
jgi:hypothetical protein